MQKTQNHIKKEKRREFSTIFHVLRFTIDSIHVSHANTQQIFSMLRRVNSFRKKLMMMRSEKKKDFL
jgi:recombinational DNA repair protein RecR